ncbi:MAG: chlorophyll synthase ChlG [Pseudoprimorskyibacter sp.]|jgi:chlorophyll synthase|nr:chlorophyll synthase ChlG [Pseudoprimorskyibacter sp.]
MTVSSEIRYRRFPEPSALLRLIKPVTWFPPMWAYLCGAISVGVSLIGQIELILLGLVLCGPVVCGMSQAANDWCDRHVDAINEPDRPIPSGRVPGRWGLWVAIAMSILALCLGALLGIWGFGATIVGVIAAWAYSAEPVRLKKSGIWGPGLVGLCYEGLPWFTGAAVLSAAAPAWPTIILAFVYAIGAHGIMTLNDFKAVKGDLQTGVRSLPVVLGPRLAAFVACFIMLAAQLLVVGLLISWQRSEHAFAIVFLMVSQVFAMRVLFRDPAKKAPWYNGVGVTLYVIGMMISAFAVRGLS